MSTQISINPKFLKTTGNNYVNHGVMAQRTKPKEGLTVKQGPQPFGSLIGNAHAFPPPRPVRAQSSDMENYSKLMMMNAALNALASPFANISGFRSSGRGGVSSDDAKIYEHEFGKTGNLYKNFREAENLSYLLKCTKESDTKLNNFNKDYDSFSRDILSSIQGSLLNPEIKEGLNEAGVSINHKDAQLSQLNIDPDKLETIDEAAATIVKDRAKINEFKGKVADGISKLGQKSQELQTEIIKIDSDIDKLESKKAALEIKNASTFTQDQFNQIEQLELQIEELKNQKQKVEKEKEKVEAAKTALTTDVNNKIDCVLKELANKERELGDIKKIKEETAKKEFEMANDINKQIKSLKKQIDRSDNDAEKAQLKQEMAKLNADIIAFQNTGRDPNSIEYKGKKFERFETIEQKYLPNPQTTLKVDNKIKLPRYDHNAQSGGANDDTLYSPGKYKTSVGDIIVFIENGQIMYKDANRGTNIPENIAKGLLKNATILTST